MALWKTALKFTSPVAWLIVEGVEQAAGAVNEASTKGNDALRNEVERQNLKLQFAQQQARVEQELAISRRIDNAEEVEIEEFYDVSGKGQIGLSADQATEAISLGATGQGRRMTRRVYKFKGWREQTDSLVEQQIEE